MVLPVEKYDGQKFKRGWIELLTLFGKARKYEWVFLLNYDYNVKDAQNNKLIHKANKLE